jgi:hypothetical protein
MKPHMTSGGHARTVNEALRVDAVAGAVQLIENFGRFGNDKAEPMELPS